MKALFLAAGRGTRLAPFTDDCPKPMLPIAGVPMIERIMNGIAESAGITSFVLVTGYRADVVHAHFGDGSRWGWDVAYAHQEIPRGVADALRCAASQLSDNEFMMTYGDIMLDPINYALFAQDNDPAKGMKVGLNWVDDPWRGAAVYLREDSSIQRIQEKPAQGTSGTNWNNAGLFIFPPTIFDYAAQILPSARGEYELPDVMTAMIEAGIPALGIPLQGAWRDVGTLEDYAAINAEFGA